MTRTIHVSPQHAQVCLGSSTCEADANAQSTSGRSMVGTFQREVGRGGGLPGTKSGSSLVVIVFEAGNCIRLWALLPRDDVELDFVTLFERFVPGRLNR